MRMGKVVIDVPAALAREIGRVIVEFANLEHRLSNLIYVLLGVDPKEGRLAVREPRATDRFGIICDLLELRKIPTPDLDLKVIRSAIEEVANERDQLAHGIWLRDEPTNHLFLRITKGGWQPQKGQRGKTKRVIVPEAVTYTDEDARKLRDIISETVEAIDFLGEVVDAAIERASRDKSRSPPPPTSPQPGRKPKAPPARREPSPA